MNKKLILLFLTLIAYFQLNAQPRFLTWTGYSPKHNWEKYFQELKDHGIDGIIISSGPEGLKKIIPEAQKYGIDVYCWLWVFNNGLLAREHPEWLDYNALGESMKDSIAYVGYYKFLNPAIKEVRETIKEQIKPFLEIEGLKGISLDYCRYVDAILPKALWGNYNIVQDKVYPKWDFGYHPEMIRQYKEKTGKEPNADDQDWLDFRCEVLNDFVNELEVLSHNYGKEITASPFPTPEMSKEMVRQDWGKWKLDKAFVMMYHNFYGEDIDWVKDCIKASRKQCYKKTKIYYGFYVSDFQGDEKKLEEALITAKKAGAYGFSIYQFQSLNPKQKQVVKEVTNKWK